MNKKCGTISESCIPGCVDPFGAHWCDPNAIRNFDEYVDVYHCAYRPQDLDAMLQRQLIHNPNQYNEVILDTRLWVTSLPDTVLAFFYSTGAGFKEPERRTAEDKARSIFDAFNSKYRNQRTPLVSVDFDARGDAPAFRLAAS